jgi:putative transposase
VVDHPNQAWASDITYIPYAKGFMYLVAIIDWHSRKVLSWRFSNTMSADFCVSALTETIAFYGTPEIFNTDQGSQFTGSAFTSILESRGVAISMDGRGRAIDNVFVERLWRTIKYEHIYLNSADSGNELRDGLAQYIEFYNANRPHDALEGKTPNEVYFPAETDHAQVA